MIADELPLIQSWLAPIVANHGEVLRVRVLDVGSSTSDFRGRKECSYNLAALLCCEVVYLDRKDGPGVDLVGDAEDLGAAIQGEQFAGVVCTSLLEHVRRPWIVARECFKCLLPGGRIFASAPWVWADHADPLDCYRFSVDGLRSIFLDAGFRQLAAGELRRIPYRISYFVGSKEVEHAEQTGGRTDG